MEVFVKQLDRWLEITDDNKELLIKFGAIKTQGNDVENNKGGNEQVSGNTKRTRKPKSTK
jgi:hypothetical protein